MSVDLWTIGSVANIQCCQFSVFNTNVEELVGVVSWSWLKFLSRTPTSTLELEL